MKKILCFVLMLGIISTAAFAAGQTEQDSVDSFPNKPMTLICPWGVGGIADVFARNVANLSSEYLGQPMVVENRTGAGGSIALTEYLANDPDGYSLQICSAPLFSLTPWVQDVQYSFDNYEPVIGQMEAEFMLATNPEISGLSSLEDLKEYAKLNKIKYASLSPGNDTHTIQAGLYKMMGIDAEAVVFTSVMECLNALLGGHVDVSIGIPGLMKDLVENDMISPIATYSAKSSINTFANHPEIPTVKDLGYDLVWSIFNFLVVLEGTPEPVVQKLYDGMVEIYKDPTFISKAEELNIKISPANGEEIKEIIAYQQELVEKLFEMIE